MGPDGVPAKGGAPSDHPRLEIKSRPWSAHCRNRPVSNV